MSLAHLATDYSLKSQCHVHGTQRPEPAWETIPYPRHRCTCLPQQFAETSYLDPRLLTTWDSSWDGKEYLSAHVHHNPQSNAASVAAEGFNSHQCNASGILPCPCLSTDGQYCMAAFSPSTSSDPSPKHEDVLQPILTVSEERYLRRKAQNREAQRAFKLRTTQYQKGLQQKVGLMEQNHQDLLIENSRLRNDLEMEKAIRSGLVEGFAEMTEHSTPTPT